MWKIKLRRFIKSLLCAHPEDYLEYCSREVGLQSFYLTRCKKCGKEWVK